MEFMKKGLIIFIGSSCIAIGIHGFLVPYGLLEGGALGISLVIHYLMDARVGFTFLIISLPIFMLAWVYYRTFFYNGLHGMLLSSLIIDIVAASDWFSQPIVPTAAMSAMVGGIVIGLGAGLMLRVNISIGGTDLLAQMLAKKVQMNAGIMIFCFDIFIVTIGSFIIPTAYLYLSAITVLMVGVTTSSIVWTAKRKEIVTNEIRV